MSQITATQLNRRPGPSFHSSDAVPARTAAVTRGRVSAPTQAPVGTLHTTSPSRSERLAAPQPFGSTPTNLVDRLNSLLSDPIAYLAATQAHEAREGRERARVLAEVAAQGKRASFQKAIDAQRRAAALELFSSLAQAAVSLASSAAQFGSQPAQEAVTKSVEQTTAQVAREAARTYAAEIAKGASPEQALAAAKQAASNAAESLKKTAATVGRKLGDELQQAAGKLPSVVEQSLQRSDVARSLAGELHSRTGEARLALQSQLSDRLGDQLRPQLQATFKRALVVNAIRHSWPQIVQQLVTQAKAEPFQHLASFVKVKASEADLEKENRRQSENENREAAQALRSAAERAVDTLRRLVDAEHALRLAVIGRG